MYVCEAEKRIGSFDKRNGLFNGRQVLSFGCRVTDLLFYFGELQSLSCEAN